MIELEIAIKKCNILLGKYSDFSTLVCRGILTNLTPDFERAINDFDNVIMMKSNVSNVCFLRTYSLYKPKRLQEALADLKKRFAWTMKVV